MPLVFEGQEHSNFSECVSGCTCVLFFHQSETTPTYVETQDTPSNKQHTKTKKQGRRGIHLANPQEAEKSLEPVHTFVKFNAQQMKINGQLCGHM